MNRLSKKLACVFMAGVLGTGVLAGCGSTIDGTKPLITCNEDTVSVGTGNLLLRMNQAQMQIYYSMMGSSTAGIWDQDSGDGTTNAEATKDTAVQQLKEMVLLKQHAKDYDISIKDEEKDIQDAAKKFVEANGEEVMTKLAITQKDVEKLLELYTYQEKMYDPMTADVDTKVDDEEAKQSRISYCRFDIRDKTNEDNTKTPLTEEEKKEKKDQAEKLLEKIRQSDDPATADMDALVKEIDEDLQGYETTFNKDEEILDKKVKEAALTLTEDGQVYDKVIEGDGFYFVLRMDTVLDREATDQQKDMIVSERKRDAFEKLMKEWEKDAKITVNEKEWKKAKLTDNDQYMIKQPEEESAK